MLKKRFYATLRVAIIPVLLPGMYACIQVEYSEPDVIEHPELIQLFYCNYNFCGTNSNATGGSTATKIYMYRTDTNYQGNFGGRATANGYCSASRTTSFSSLACTNDLAFVSYGGDAVLDFPTNHAVPASVPIVSPTEVTIDSNWAGLFDGNISVSVNGAGISTLTATYWTGSQSNGTVSGTNCSDWSTTAPTGTRGLRTSTNTNWIDDTSPNLCTGSLVMLCICW